MRLQPQIRLLARHQDHEKNNDDLLLTGRRKKNRLQSSPRRNTKKLSIPFPLLFISIGGCLFLSFLIMGGMFTTLDGRQLVQFSGAVEPSTLIVMQRGNQNQQPALQPILAHDTVAIPSTTLQGKNGLQSRTTQPQQPQVNFVLYEGAIQLDAAFPSKRGGAIMEQPDGLDSSGDSSGEGDSLSEEQEPDYGGLTYRSIQHAAIFARRILMRDRESLDQEHRHQDPFKYPPARAGFGVAEEELGDCRRNNWTMNVFPTCNPIHEVTLGRPRRNYSPRRNYQQDYNVKYLR
jgi:hypothetical protein